MDYYIVANHIHKEEHINASYVIKFFYLTSKGNLQNLYKGEEDIGTS